MLDTRTHRGRAVVKEVKLFVEGGGARRKSQIACRESFRLFIKNAGFEGKMPRIVACGSRNVAFDRYRKAVLSGKEAFLLVDSERPVHVDCWRGEPEDWLPGLI